MKVVSRVFVVAAIVILLAQAAAAQTADEVVEKYLNAIGARAALGKLSKPFGENELAAAIAKIFG